MADENYARLSCGACGNAFERLIQRGRRPANCSDCKADVERARAQRRWRADEPAREERRRTRKEKAQIQCRSCSGFFVPSRQRGLMFCSRKCADDSRARPHYTCANCGESFKPKAVDRTKYCSRECSFAAKGAARRLREADRPTMSAWFAAFCACGAAHGSRREWQLCPACERDVRLAAARDATLAVSIAKHRARAKEVICRVCGLAFCPLYGAVRGETVACDPCLPTYRREVRLAAKAKRRARVRSVTRETVIRRKVFERDGWMCRLCGVPTPPELNATTEPDAPEHDHIVPVARGGAHTYANAQCLCRSCNGMKHDKTMDEVLGEVLAAFVLIRLCCTAAG